MELKWPWEGRTLEWAIWSSDSDTICLSEAGILILPIAPRHPVGTMAVTSPGVPDSFTSVLHLDLE